MRSLMPATARLAALYSYSRALKSVATTVNDMYRQLDSLADHIATFHSNDGQADGRIKVRVGLKWLSFAGDALLRKAVEAVKQLHTGLHIHPYEPRTEVWTTRSRHLEEGSGLWESPTRQVFQVHASLPPTRCP
ncbi:unnamed protein product [Discula destructiva]